MACIFVSAPILIEGFAKRWKLFSLLFEIHTDVMDIHDMVFGLAGAKVQQNTYFVFEIYIS
jgi:hypothetical protein